MTNPADPAAASLFRVPTIAEVAPGVARPLWSVMIPIYNCTRYLGEALASVLEQDPGPDAMQIAVLDNVSSDRPEEIVERLGRGRVEFHRHPTNIGSIPNCNACIQRSRGHLVHILHCDDRVAPGFYREMSRLAESAPDTALFACRSLYIDSEGVLLNVSARVPALERPSRDPAPILNENVIQIGSAVVRRSFYEKAGGFNEALAHTADWEMWIRAIAGGGGLMSHEALAYFNVSGAVTSRARQSGENIRDHLRMLDVLRARMPHLNLAPVKRHVVQLAADQSRMFREQGDMESARANERLWGELVSIKVTSRRAAQSAGRIANDVLRLLMFRARQIVRGRSSSRRTLRQTR